MGTLDAWMASEKVNLKTIGIFSLVGLPYTMKFLWAPLLDRFSLPFLHRRAGWMVFFQAALLLSIMGMGVCDPKNGSLMLAFFAVLTAFFSASQDIVIDAYRAELLKPEEMGAGAAVGVLGARLALLTAGAVALILSDHFSWRHVYFLMAGLMGIGFFTAILSPAPTQPSRPPRSLEAAVVEPFLDFFRRPAALQIILFIILYKLSDAVAGKMTTPFLIDLGFSKTEIGTVNKGFGMIVTIFGALFGGGLIAKMGIGRALLWFGVLMGFSNLVFVSLANAGKSPGLMIACIGIENLCGGMGTAAFVAFLTSLCKKEYAGTQYALLSSIMAITRTIAGTATGYMAVGLGWVGYFSVSAALAIPSLILLKVYYSHITAPAVQTAA